MKKFLARAFALVGCLLTLAAGGPVHAGDCLKDSNGNVVCGQGQCAADQSGKVFCAREGGGAMQDQYGNVKCGVGNCAKNDLGELKCSKTPGGGAATDSYGKVKCLGGCQNATKQLCAIGR